MSPGVSDSATWITIRHLETGLFEAGNYHWFSIESSRLYLNIYSVWQYHMCNFATGNTKAQWLPG